jgi:hypothetical protein
MGGTPKYDITDLFVALDFSEWAEFFRCNDIDEDAFSFDSTSCKVPSFFILNLP